MVFSTPMCFCVRNVHSFCFVFFSRCCATADSCGPAHSQTTIADAPYKRSSQWSIYSFAVSISLCLTLSRACLAAPLIISLTAPSSSSVRVVIRAPPTVEDVLRHEYELCSAPTFSADGECAHVSAVVSHALTHSAKSHQVPVKCTRRKSLPMQVQRLVAAHASGTDWSAVVRSACVSLLSTRLVLRHRRVQSRISVEMSRNSRFLEIERRLTFVADRSNST